MESWDQPMATEDEEPCVVQRYIGRIIEIVIYPLDGGCPWFLPKAYCTKGGLMSPEDDLLDRSFIVYCPSTRRALLNFHKPELGVIRNASLIRELTRQNRQLDRLLGKNEEIVINYLGYPMTVMDEGKYVEPMMQQQFGKELGHMRIAYCSQENRQKFEIDKSLQFPDSVIFADNLSSYFANYTLINTDSLQYLQMYNQQYLTPQCFRGNLTMQGFGKPFIEDVPTYTLDIGENRFRYLSPCTHTARGLLKQSTIRNPEILEPYNFLKRYRILNQLRPEFRDYRSPTFGLNMELASPEGSLINVGDYVFSNYLTSC